MTMMTFHKTTSALLLVGLIVLQSTTARTQNRSAAPPQSNHRLKPIRGRFRVVARFIRRS